MPILRSDLSATDLEELRSLYTNSSLSSEELCDRFAFSPGGLRQFAHRRGWTRPKDLYRKGVPKKEIPTARRETAKLLWDTGENCKRIGCWIGVSANTARDLCRREFGYRNLRLNRQTYFFRRNLQMLAMYNNGTSIEELADFFWLGPKSVRELLSRTRKSSEMNLLRTASKELKTTLKRCAEHEHVLHSAISIVASDRRVPATSIIWPTRGPAPMAFARGVCMYLVHVEASYSLSDTGFLFGRDRTTVAHACVIVEDRRDHQPFDDAMESMSEKFRTHLSTTPTDQQVPPTTTF